jgi:excinuclease ABC subunit A
VERALKLSGGLVKITFGKNERIFNQNFSCPDHPEVEFPEMEPRLFSFNNPYGACPSCEGLGTKKEIDVDLVAPDKNKTIAEGGLMPWSYKKNNWQGTILRAVCNYFHIADNMRLRDLSSEKLSILLFGAPDAKDRISFDEAEEIPVTLRSKTGSVWKYNVVWRGVLGYLEDRYKKTDSDAVRADIEKYMSQNPCSVCHGSRYMEEALLITVGGKNIDEVSRLSIDDSLVFFKKLSLTEQEKLIAERITREVVARLGFLSSVGLSYLTLSRSANTLAGGETQRIRLASQVGSGLPGVR